VSGPPDLKRGGDPVGLPVDVTSFNHHCLCSAVDTLFRCVAVVGPLLLVGLATDVWVVRFQVREG
jgi:hypothetical protein